MRRITYKERGRHGCWDCMETVRTGRGINKCPHDRCPYSEMDAYKSYAEYLEKTKGDTPLVFFFPKADFFVE